MENKLIGFAILWLIGSIIIIAGCIPEIPAPVVEVVNECYVPPVIPKSTLPTVEYIRVDGFKCFTDIEQELNAVKRESLIQMDSNNCRDQYSDVEQRCNENK